MKKFKLFALAVFAMLSTNVFAQFTPYEDANTIFRFKVTAPYSATPTETLGEATIIGFVADYAAFATTAIPATVNGATKGGKFKVTGIGTGTATGAFEGKAITTLDLSAAENLVTIEANAFKGTSITTLDLSATQVATVDQWFETTNTKVTTVKLPKTVTTFAPNAFEGLSALNSVTFAERTASDGPYNLVINADVFKNTMALKTLTLPADVAYIATNAFEKTYLTELTINGDLLTGAVASDAFAVNGSQKLTVNFNPTQSKELATSFAQDAFGAYDDAVWVTFKTTTHYGETTLATLTADTKGNVLYGAKLDFTPTGLATIPVYNQGGSYSYGTFYDTSNGITIDKKQDGANVMVYGAYVDDTNPVAVLMDQLHLIGGKYYIPAGTPVIVKTSGTAAVKYVKACTDDSRNFNPAGTKNRSEIEVYDLGPTTPDTYAADIAATAPKDYIIFLKPLDETAFGWAEFADNRIIKKGQFYLQAKTPAASVRVIWLDGSEEEEATAIKNVKSAKAENGVIYNLAGQKVNAAYKGVVIKDGKKYIQK